MKPTQNRATRPASMAAGRPDEDCLLMGYDEMTRVSSSSSSSSSNSSQWLLMRRASLMSSGS